ncbi:iron ABC transporter permease [uncultured Maricaulis sp.]|uniref:FecCD family ABC transporter permease n=1 Tax=uncultured Maricaulis sp. TaxID=174710 RepID=UPI002606BFBD|nr:iron ABC transporter permease [uncultured Maricaulis sp.]
MTPLRLTVLLAALLALVAVIALFAGSGGAGPAALFSADEELGGLVLRELRLPRVLLGILVGAGLGASGAALQGFFRNPLADPGVVGVSASAGLGAVICLYFGLSSLFALALPLAGVAGSALGVIALFAIAGRGASATTLILAGVAVNATAGACTALLMNLAPNPWALAEIAYWLMGSLSDASWTEVGFATPVILAGLVVLMPLARGLDALGLGEDTARSLGIGLGRLRLAVVLGTALAVGGGVAVAGAIGFVGLVVPHILRPLVAWRAGALILPSALGGAVLIVLADLATRLLSGPGIPLYLGVLTALIGAPFFLWLVRHTQRRAP